MDYDISYFVFIVIYLFIMGFIIHDKINKRDIGVCYI